MKQIALGILLTIIVSSGWADDRPAPASWALERDSASSLATVDQLRFGALDLESISAEDAQREAVGEPVRFAFPHQTSFDTSQRGTWEQAGETSIWRLHVSAENATLINFGFKDVHLPDGSALYIYSRKAADTGRMERHSVIGPYDSSINRDHGEFWTPNLQSDEAIIEINVPTDLRDQLGLTLAQVSQGYRGFGQSAANYHQNLENISGDGKQACETEGGARSGSCNQDVACLSEGDPWNDPRRSVGAYQRSGAFACTGSLLNNTANDQRMLFVTATHCIVESQAASIVVYWNYEWPTCRRPGASGGTDVNPPDPNESNSGGTWLAATVNPFTGGGCTDGTECSDMTLIELDDPADPEFNLHWSGWDRRPPPTACAQGPGGSTDGLCATIHHPGVDEKRITWVEDDIQIGSIAASNNVHWHPFWHPNPPELPNMPDGSPATIPPAVTEGGSSGSPLYTADRRLIGVLSGGPAFCGATGSQLSDFYGGLFHAWDGLGSSTTRMKDHLDPLGTEPLFIEGIDGEGFSLDVDPVSISQCGFDDVVLAIDVTSNGGFADPVTLATIDLPAAASENFSVNPVTPPDTSSLTLGNLATVGSGSYDFTIEGVAGDLTRLVPISLDLTDSAPGVASITAPTEGALGVSATPTIEWSAASQAVAYELEIASDVDFNDVVYTVSVSGTSHQVEQPLDTNSTYYLRVRADNECGVADWSETISFTTESLPGDCPLGTTASDLMMEDFDGGTLPPDWSTAGSSGTVTWVASTDQAHSGSHSMFAQNVGSVTDQHLATPSISVPDDAVSVFLNFQNWQSVESSDTGCYDGGLLEISTDDGGSWTQVSSDHILVRDYDGSISDGFSNPLGGSQGWCGDPRDSWDRYSVDLANWAGQDVRFRFRVGTDASVTRVGWYVDSVNVKACLDGSQPIIFEDRFESDLP